MTWGQVIRRVAGAISLSQQPDAISAARDAVQETLEDMDTRRDWRFTQVVAPDIPLTAGQSSFQLPTLFKKPYVAYLASKHPLFYIERANWHRVYPGSTFQTISKWYSLFNDASTGNGDLFPPSAAADTLTLLYYRPISYIGGDDDLIDLPQRWSYVLTAGGKMRLISTKVVADKSRWWEEQYEKSLKRAKEDDLRIPDQFVSFQPPDAFNVPPWWNPNSAWQSVWGVDP